jgi:aryl-alcohol dehydrogenase-like predicted oxidoreductase
MLPALRTADEPSRNNRFPRIILGTAALGGIRGAIDRREAVQTILEALTAGIQMIDTAPSYGNAESLVGEALSLWRGPTPMISTKVGKYWESQTYFNDYRPAKAEQAIANSCKLLGRQSLDCVYLHEPNKMPQSAKADYVRCLVGLQNAGLTKLLGLGGGHGADWDDLVETGAFGAAILHSRMDAIMFDAVEADVPRLRQANMAVLGGSLLHKGLLGDRTDEYLQRAPAWLSPSSPPVVKRLQQLAKASGVPLPTLAHRFAFSVREIDSVIIGPETRFQLHQSLRALAEGPLDRKLFESICACQGGA